MIRVLFVCTGNVCRSPMAEGLLRKLLREQERSADFVVESAGTLPLDGAPPSSNSVEVCAREGVDLRGHAARAVTRRMIDRADLILTMEPAHRDRIVALVPEASEKCFVLTTYAGKMDMPDGVPDPIGMALDVYDVTLKEIDASIRAALPRILALLEEGTEPTGKRTV